MFDLIKKLKKKLSNKSVKFDILKVHKAFIMFFYKKKAFIMFFLSN